VKVQITVGSHTYRPMVSRDGSFHQMVFFSQTYAEMVAARRNPSASRAKQYTINVTATDESGNSGAVTRNVIYNPVHNGNDN
jgi:hypothetical protein